jgi:F-type H+-transporting ATPase subunit a
MPHGESWFSLLPFNERLLLLAHVFSKPFSDDGLSWYAHEPIKLQHVYGACFVLLLLLLLGILTSSSIRKAKGDLLPESRLTVRNFAEIFITATYSLMSGIMGKQAARHFLPLIGTCAFFIFFSNAIGLIPGFFPPTSKLNTTVACAVVIFFATHIYGVKEQGFFKYFKHFMGPLIGPQWIVLMAIMFVIELISHFARPVSLSIRLMANMTADHVVVGAFLAMVPFLVPVPMMLLGCLVVIVQTLVFCLLSTVYIALAIEHGEH